MRSILVSGLVLVVLFLSFSCNEGYDFSQASLGLGLRDFSCTEAWIEVQIGSNDKTANIYIKKNGEIIQTVNVGQSSTLYYFDSLLPNTNYTFDAVTYEDGKEVKSNPVTFTTLDTTSHNFTWQTFTFGQHSNSVLYDVAIINENDIWAVGEIYMNDSLGNPDPICYNAVHWNGQYWEIKKIAVTYNGNQTIAPLKGIFVLPAGEIIFSSGLPYLPEGNGWKLYHLWDMGVLDQNDGGVDRIWGTSLNDLYFAGNKGTIVHYNGTSWTKIASGTTSIINDAWGFLNEQNKTIIYCPIASFFTVNDKKILKIVDGVVDSVSWNKDVRLYSAWAQNENFLYVCGEGVFVNKFGNWSEIILQPIGTNSIRGNNINDIFIDGDYGFIAHFNGLNWHIYNNDYLKGYSRLSFKGDIVAIAGNYQGKALVEIGRRN